jgi:hypothetical protein
MKNVIRAKVRTIGLIMVMLGSLSLADSQTTLPPTYDSYIQGGDNSGTNFGDNEDIRIKGSDNLNFCRKGLLQFDLSSISEVNTATLRLYANVANSYTLTAFATTDDWDESSVTWDSAPAEGSAIASTAISAEGVYYEWDVTSYIKEQLSADGKASIYLIDPNLLKENVDFNSKEMGLNPPELVITTQTINYSSIPAIADAYTFYWGKKKHIANYGSETRLQIQYDNNVESTMDAYVKFDIGSFTEPLKDVFLQLYVDSLERGTRISIYNLSKDQAWNESTISGYNNPPDDGRIGLYTISGTGLNRFDISEFFNKAVSEDWNYLTLVLKESEGGFVSFYSKEAGDNNPQLIYGDETSTYTPPDTYSGTFYIDSENGNDDNSGTSEDQAWKNINTLEHLTFEPGASILLKRGSIWNKQTLSFKGSGTVSAPILIDAYGSGNKPSLRGDGAVYDVIQIFNQEYIEIANLDIQNEGPSMDNLRRGIYILADNYGAMQHLHFTGIDFSNINGSDGTVKGIYGNTDDEKRSGGILMEVRGDDVKTYYDGILIDQCYFFNVSNTGFANSSHWSTLNINSDWNDNTIPGTSNSHYVHNFVPSKNIVIRRSRFENIMSQGLIIRTAEDPVMEYNLFYYCSLGDGSDNACFNSKTTGAVWRYNESCYTQWLSGQGDGAGIDSDIRTINTLIEYNYCHHNEYGGVITTGGRFSTSFNDNTIIRYNILANNGHNSIRLCNRNTNAKVHNNLIYYDNASEMNRLVFQHLHNDTDTGPTDTYMSNNIFYTTNNNGRFLADVAWTDPRVERCHYSNNVYYGIDPLDQYPDDANKVTADPLFKDGTIPTEEIGGYVLLNEDGIPTGEINPDFLDGFKLSENSQAIDAGIDNPYVVLPDIDFGQKTIPLGAGIDIGPFEFDASSGTDVVHFGASEIKVYPNPAQDMITVSGINTIEKISICSVGGREVLSLNRIQSKEKIVGTDNLPQGIYLIKVTDNTGTTSVTKLFVN